MELFLSMNTINTSNSDLFNINAIFGYLIVALMPLSFLGTGVEGSYVYTVNSMRFYEVIMLIYFPFLLIRLATAKIQIAKINKLDIFVLGFVYANLIPVILSWDLMYYAARDYRHQLLVPLIAYVLYKMSFSNIQQVVLSVLILVVSVYFQLFIVIFHFLTSGTRVVGDTQFLMLTVPLGVLLSWGAAILLFHRKMLKSRVRRILETLAILVLAIGMLANMSRSAIFWFVLFAPLSMKFLKRQWFKNITILLFMSGMCIFFTALYTMPTSPLKITSTYGERHSVQRLISPHQFTESALARVQRWKKCLQHAVKSPIYGKGMAFYHTLELGAAHPHNVYVSTLLSSGIIGLTGLMLVIYHHYSLIFYISKRVPFRSYYFVMGQILFTCFSILLLVGVTNDFIGALYPFFFLILAMGSKTRDLLQIDVEPIGKSLGTGTK